MHPDDVADYVQASVEELSRQLNRYPGLVKTLALEARTSLFITFEKTERPTIQAAVPSRILLPGGAGIAMQYQVPDLAATPITRDLILHIGLDDYDGDPPTADLLLPDRSPLPSDQWPILGEGGIVLDHPHFRRPFFCRRGLREYHTHPQHEDDPWDRHREGLPLYAVVLEVLDDLQHRWVGRR